MIRKIAYTALVLSLGFQTACLKTRSQVKEDKEPEMASKYEMEEMKNEVLRLSGRIEELQLEQTQKPDDTVKTTQIDERMNELEKNQLLILTELKALKDAAAEPAKKKQNLSSVLHEGHKALKSKKYDSAESKFREVLNRSPKGNNAAEARFGLGESLYGQKQYKRAIVEYSKVQELSSKSKKVAPSLYKIGLSFTKLKMNKEAKGFFAELVERFPKTSEAKKAKKKLKSR